MMNHRCSIWKLATKEFMNINLKRSYSFSLLACLIKRDIVFLHVESDYK